MSDQPDANAPRDTTRGGEYHDDFIEDDLVNDVGELGDLGGGSLR